MTRQVCVQPPTAAVSVTLLAFAADHRAVVRRCCRALADRRPPRSIDISRPRGAQQQTRRTLLQRSIDGTDRQLTVTKTLLRMQAVITDFVSVEDNAIGRVSVRPFVSTVYLTFELDFCMCMDHDHSSPSRHAGLRSRVKVKGQCKMRMLHMYLL